MEFKDQRQLEQLQQKHGINRIRLEFKVLHSKDILFGAFVLIESDWNLKWEDTKLKTTVDTVLIESDWNLKDGELNFEEEKALVLIESDWNLKVTSKCRMTLDAGVLIESDWNLRII